MVDSCIIVNKINDLCNGMTSELFVVKSLISLELVILRGTKFRTLWVIPLPRYVQTHIGLAAEIIFSKTEKVVDMTIKT